MKILSYDTSSDILGIAVFENEKKIIEIESQSFARHSSILVPSLEKALKAANTSLDEIDVLAVGLGPGSFTGLRVGITVAKTLGYVKTIKIVGVPSLEAIAWEAQDFKGDIAVILDAKKEKLYSGVYEMRHNKLKVIRKPRLSGIDALLKGLKRPRLFLGDGVKFYRDKILRTKFCEIRKDSNSVYPKASYIARQGLFLAKEKKFLDPMTMEPLYLHPRDCNVTVHPTYGAKR